MMKNLTKREMITFAAGDLFGGGAQLVIAFFYLRFLTDVVRINPLLAGTVILLSKVWDAVSDPMMGIISDNTRTRFGRRKPYLLAGFFLILVAFTLLWYAPNLETQGAKFTFVLISYLFYSTISTIVMVPYTAMSSEITEDIIKRGRINGSRLFFSQISSLIGAVLPMVIVGLFPEKTGYLMMGLIFSIFYAVPFLGIFLWCHERTPIPEARSKFNVKEILSPFKIKTYRYLIGMYLSAFFVMDIVSAVFTYYMTYYIGREDLLELVLGTMLITQIAALALVVLLTEKIGKPKTFIGGALIFITGVIALGFYNVTWPIWAIFVIAGVVGLGLIALIVIPWVMFPDVTDISVLAFGERRSGAFAGFMTFLRKFSSAIGIWIVGLMLQLTGYILPGEVIAPTSAAVYMPSEQVAAIDLNKDKTDDIIVDFNTHSVSFPNGIEYDYTFTDDAFVIEENAKISVVVERGLEITKPYDFDASSTVKSIKARTQPQSFINGLRVIIFVIPGILMILAMFIASKYPLTIDIHKRLVQYNQSFSGESDVPFDEKMTQQLKEQLI